MKRGIITMAASLLTLATTGIGAVFAATSSYTVQSGDTFYKISVSQGVPLAALEASNPQISNPTNITPGETLYLPTTYQIAPGDTLYKIASAHGVTLTALERANPQITNYTNLTIGQTLFIPTYSTYSTPAAVASTSTASTTGSTTTLGQAIINYAEQYIGTPYVWGGNSPSTGFDCSGFVQYVYGHFGITLPRESHDQATVGTSVSQAALQPGDLLFFTDTDALASEYANHVTHVGIYIGNGAMIESATANNDEGVVIVNNVFSNPYYVSHYYGARNVLS